MRRLESRKQVRHQLVTHRFIGDLLLHLRLNDMALGTSSADSRLDETLAQQEHIEAHTELSLASALAKDIGRVRPQMDAEHTPARLLRAQRRTRDAQYHLVTARDSRDDREEPGVL